jgi:DNA-binding MarR family transcriptional regulator
LRKARPAKELVLGSPELETVANNFATDPQLDWMLASTSVVRAHKIISSRVNAILFQVEQLTMARYEILGHLYGSDGGELGVRDLKRASFLQPPTMTYNLDWLEARDLVVRQGNREDRRTVIISITDAGRELFEKANAALGKIHFGLVGLSTADARAVAQSLAKVKPT